MPNEVGPLTSVVGIGLFQRTVLTLQRAGIRQLMVLVGPEEDQLKQALSKGSRVTIPVRWLPIREFPLDDPRTWDALAAEVRGFCLLSGVQGVFASPLIESLRREVQEGQAIVVARADRERESTVTPVEFAHEGASGTTPLDHFETGRCSVGGDRPGGTACQFYERGRSRRRRNRHGADSSMARTGGGGRACAGVVYGDEPVPLVSGRARCRRCQGR